MKPGPKISPFSRLAQHDIGGAQARINFSEWDAETTAEGPQNAINSTVLHFSHVACSSTRRATPMRRPHRRDGAAARQRVGL